MRNNTKVWRAVYTKPRNEKKVAERLEQQGIEVYCPVQTTLKQWSDRKKKVSVPIFPSYVFLRLSEKESDLVLQDPGVLNFVYWLGKYAVIRKEEIEIIRAFLNHNQTNLIEVVSCLPDENVEITAGPFKGQSGTVLRYEQDRTCVIIPSVNMMLRVKISVENLKVATID